MKKFVCCLFLLTVLLAASACSSGNSPMPPDTTDTAPVATQAAPTEAPTATQAAAEPVQPNVETEFPVLADAFEMLDLGNSSISYKTKMKQAEIITFYRDEFKKAGYTEREIATVISDTLFSMVFDGHASGKAIVLQAVDLGGSTNVTLRFE
jgi:hypothetical protein